MSASGHDFACRPTKKKGEPSIGLASMVAHLLTSSTIPIALISSVSGMRMRLLCSSIRSANRPASAGSRANSLFSESLPEMNGVP